MELLEKERDIFIKFGIEYRGVIREKS